MSRREKIIRQAVEDALLPEFAALKRELALFRADLVAARLREEARSEYRRMATRIARLEHRVGQR